MSKENMIREGPSQSAIKKYAKLDPINSFISYLYDFVWLTDDITKAEITISFKDRDIKIHKNYNDSGNTIMISNPIETTNKQQTTNE